MRIGIFGAEPADFDQLVADVQAAAADGFATYWRGQVFGTDALTAFAVAGRAVPTIELGTAVVPTYPRHPMVLASQALTVQSAIGGRLTLGVGPSHRIVVESNWGYSFDRAVAHTREYVTVLTALLARERVRHAGELVTCNGSINIPSSVPAPPLLVAALGTAMLRMAAELASGTVTWMTGPRALDDHIVPTIRAAAAQHGRPEPRIVCALPVCVTDDAEGVRAAVADNLAIYGSLPSYRAMLNREHAAGPGDVAIVGNEAAVVAAIQRVRDAGATDFAALDVGRNAEERRATRDLLKGLL